MRGQTTFRVLICVQMHPVLFENMPSTTVYLYIHRVFIRYRRSENSPSTTVYTEFSAKFCSFPERALLFHNNSPATLLCSPATTILNENPAYMQDFSESIANSKLTLAFA